MGNRVYVANISFNSSEKDLYDFMGTAGKVQTVRIMIDRDTGRSRGFGFVTMASEEDAKNAIGKLNGQDFFGRRLFVNEAREREQNGAAPSAPRQNRDFAPRNDNFRRPASRYSSGPEVTYVSPNDFGGPQEFGGRADRRERTNNRRSRNTESFDDFE